MKMVIRTWNLSLFIMLFVLIIASIIQKDLFQSELKSVVSDALVQTTQIIVDERYEIENNEEFMAEFEQHLLRNIRSIEGLELEVYFLGIDPQKGIISVFVEEKVPFLFFTERKITMNTQQSIIVDKKYEEIVWYDIRYHNVRLDQLPSYTPFVHAYGKDTLLVEPINQEKRFKGWQTLNGEMIEKIDANTNKAIDVYAIWE